MTTLLTLSQINPCVRYAREDRLAVHARRAPVCARDGRLFYLYEGECALWLAQGSARLGPRSAVLLPAGTPYCLTPEQPVRLFSVNFDYTQARSSAAAPFPLLPGNCALPDEERSPAFSDCETLNRPLLVRGADVLEPVLAEMKREFAERRRFFERQLSALMLRALTLLLRQALWEDDRQPSAVERMIDCIQARYAAPLSNEEIAACVSYHPVHANRLMRVHTGMTIHQYLLAVRLQRALDLLLTTPLSITEIALQTGYSSAGRFAKHFREATGHTPSEFRRAQRAEEPEAPFFRPTSERGDVP